MCSRSIYLILEILYTSAEKKVKTEIIELWSDLHKYIDCLKNEKYFDWKELDWNWYAVLCCHEYAEVIKTVRVVIFIINTVSAHVIDINFSITATLIVAAVNETALISKSDSWILFTALNEQTKLQEVWMTENHQQLMSLMIFKNIYVNSFSLSERNDALYLLMCEDHSHVTLVHFNHMSTSHLHFINHCSYQSKLKSFNIVNSQHWSSAFLEWFCIYFQNDNMWSAKSHDDVDKEWSAADD